MLYPRYWIQRCVYFDPDIYPAPETPHDDYPDLRSHATQKGTAKNLYVIATVIPLMVFGMGVLCGYKIYKNGCSWTCAKKRELTLELIVQ